MRRNATARYVDRLCCCWSALCTIVAGCGGYSRAMHETTGLYAGQLDECSDVSLSHGLVEEREGLQVRYYEQLTLRLRPREGTEAKYVVATRDRKPFQADHHLRYEDVEARVDDSGQRLWFVDRGTGRVIFTLDRQTGRTTGLDDEPPAWALPDGGSPLSPPEPRR